MNAMGVVVLGVLTIAIWAAIAIWVLRRALEPVEIQLRRIADELELMDELRGP